MEKISFFIAFVLVTHFSMAQTAGTLDSTFGHNGVISSGIGSGLTEFEKISVQQDGDIVAAGIEESFTSSNIILCCFHENGTLNEDFGSGGIIYIDDSSDIFFLGDLLLLPDDKILLSVNKLNSHYATTEFRLYRFLQDGTPDILFGNSGVVEIPAPGDQSTAFSLQLQNGNILLLASLTSQTDDGGIVYRFTSDGQLDLSFGKQGRANLIPESPNALSQWANSLVVQPDGKIISGGYAFINPNSYYWVGRYTKNGRLDKTFADEGEFLIDLGLNGTGLTQLALQPDGKIIGAGHSSNDNDFHLKLFRLLPQGTLDPSFGTNGVVQSAIGSVNQIGSLQIQSDGKIALPVIYAATDTPYFTFHVVRFNADGSPDPEWGENGVVTTKIGRSSLATDCVLQPDGKLLASGSMFLYGSNSSNPVIVRYHTGLDLRLIEPAEAETKNFIYPNPVSDAALLEYDLNEEVIVSIQLFDLNGSRIQNFVMNEVESAGHHEQLLNVSNLPAGNYFIEMTAGENRSVIKLVKQ